MNRFLDTNRMYYTQDFVQRTGLALSVCETFWFHPSAKTCRNVFQYQRHMLNTLTPGQDGRHFANDIFFDENLKFSNKPILKYAPDGLIDNK